MGNLFTKEKSNDNSCRPSRGSDGYPRQQEKPTEPEKSLQEGNKVAKSAPDIPRQANNWSDASETIKTPDSEKRVVAEEPTQTEQKEGSLKNMSKSSSKHSIKLSTSTSKHSKIELEELSVKDLPQTGTIAKDTNFGIHGQNQRSPSEKSLSERNASLPQTPEKPQIPSVLGNLSVSSSRKSLRNSKPTTPLDAPNSPFRSPSGKQSPLVKSPSAQSPLASSPDRSQKSGFGSFIKSPSATSPLVEGKTESSAALQELVRSSSNSGTLGSTIQNDDVSPSKEEDGKNKPDKIEQEGSIDAPLELVSSQTAAEPVSEKIDDLAPDFPEGLPDSQTTTKSTSKSSLKSQNSERGSQTHRISNSGSQKSIPSSKSHNFEHLSESSSKKSLRSSASNQDFTKFSKSESNMTLSVLAEGETTVDESRFSQDLTKNQKLSMSSSSSKKSLRSQKSTSSTANRVVSPPLSEEPQSIFQDAPSSISKSSSKLSIAGKSDTSSKIDAIINEKNNKNEPTNGGNPFGEISKMNSAPQCDVYDGSAVKPSQSIETEGGMTCEDVSFAESIPLSTTSAPEIEDPALQEYESEVEKATSSGDTEQISNSSSRKCIKQADSPNLENEKEMTDLM